MKPVTFHAAGIDKALHPITLKPDGCDVVAEAKCRHFSRYRFRKALEDRYPLHRVTVALDRVTQTWQGVVRGALAPIIFDAAEQAANGGHYRGPHAGEMALAEVV